MPSLYSRESRLASAALLVSLGLALAACSSSSGGGTNSPSVTTQPSTPVTSPSTSGEPTTGAGAIAAIKANWAEFFNAKTPIARRLALLQDGQVLAQVIKAQAGSSLATLATSKVSNVSLTGTTQASVTYTILVGGKPALSDQSGVAIYQDGTWKVGLVSFCGLLKLEGTQVAACKG